MLLAILHVRLHNFLEVLVNPMVNPPVKEPSQGRRRREANGSLHIRVLVMLHPETLAINLGSRKQEDLYQSGSKHEAMQGIRSAALMPRRFSVRTNQTKRGWKFTNVEPGFSMMGTISRTTIRSTRSILLHACTMRSESAIPSPRNR